MVRAALVALLTIVLPSVLQAQTWPIKEFEVVNVRPSGVPVGDNPNRDLLRGAFTLAARALGIDPDYVETVPLDPATRAALEEHLHESAELLETWGFPPPAMEPVVTRADGVEAYRVYLVAGLAQAAGEYLPACHAVNYSRTTEAVVLLDADEVLTEGRVSLLGFHTAGHELVHAVQFATPFFEDEDCERTSVGNWITEGQARAVGWDLVRARGTIDMSEFSAGAYGPRRYSIPLPVALRARGVVIHNDPAYETASLWRYLAELAFLDQTTRGLPGPERTPFDYRYLPEFLSRPATARDCRAPGDRCDAELTWLDENVRRRFGRSLRDVFPGFAGTVIDYGAQRIAEESGRTPGSQDALDGQRYWQSEVLECHTMELVVAGGSARAPDEFDVNLVGPVPLSGTREVTMTLERFERVSAQCFPIRIHGFDESQAVAVTAESGGAGGIEGLLGWVAGVSTGAEPPEVETDATGTVRASWVVEASPSEDTRLVLSNVARNAGSTEPLDDVVLTFTLLEPYATMGTNVTTGSGPSGGDVAQPVSIVLDENLTGSAYPMPTRPYTAPDIPDLANACVLRVFNLNNAAGDAVSFSMDHDGPITPGEYPIVYADVPEKVPGSVIAGFAVGAANPLSQNERQGFSGDSGTLTIESVSGGFLRGRIDINGVNGLRNRLAGSNDIPSWYLPRVSIRVDFGLPMTDPAAAIFGSRVSQCLSR